MVNTYDGSTPKDPRNPTASDNDGHINLSFYDSNKDFDTLYGYGALDLWGNNGKFKRTKLRLRAYNSVGAGPVSGVYSYNIDLR